ncbi:hypothetical protein KSE_40350 [Kitasatospora setae KM-6054]|uniref:Uncharacterized protein n=1 Tax=Kitasatospora setae (strain ATCC 33774 / DSM 43861 / JCM 3304 / KCC A-0304 / NBRC 14216 / KM-6054) TaxID=452652 RepID=E4NEP1_KITSK|nr:hypothetical protein KSE_40350 [Kitasatospora setae KM-6054]
MIRFARAQRERWPALYFCGAPAADALDAGWRPAVDPDEEYPEILTFSSGAPMEEFWEEHGYALDEKGEGPFSLFYSFHRARIGARLENVDTENEEVGRSAAGTELVLSKFFLVSLVTPANPEDDGFSRGVLDDFRRAFEA